MKIKRILGELPIFASDSKLGNRTDVKGNIVPADSSNAFYSNNMLAYSKGTEKVTPEIFNGALNYVTKNMSYLFHRGVPEFSLNVAYSQGSIVTFDGGLYVSLTDDNTLHVTQSSHWGRFVIEHNTSKHNKYPHHKVSSDSNPIGTILTVPVHTNLDGYMDFVEGAEFSTVLYPELYKALGSNRFGKSKTTNNELPIGSVIHVLGEENVPEGWIEWNQYSSLYDYPDLYNVLSKMVEHMPLNNTKQVWLEALRNYRLPMFSLSGFHLGMKGNVGTYIENASGKDLLAYPVVIDESNTLNPLGVSRCVIDKNKDTVGAVVDVTNTLQKQSTSSVVSPLVIVAHRAEQHKDVVANMLIADVAKETVPNTVSTRLFVKATNQRPSNILSTHKQVIKYVS